MHRSFHWKRLLAVAGVFILLSGSLFALNRVQVKRQASVIKTVAVQADSSIAGDKDRRSEAIAHFSNYLKLNPNDEEFATRYAQLLFDQYEADPSPTTMTSTASGVELFLRRFPEHPQERRKLAELYLRMGKIRTAREHIDVLFNSNRGDFKHDVELLEMTALCEQLSGQNTQAIQRLDEAIKTGKAPVRTYNQLLLLLNTEKADPLRESKIAGLVRALKKDPFQNNLEARIAVARFELLRHEYENARDDIEYARTKIPGGADNAEVMLAAAEWQIAGARSQEEMKPRYTAARTLLERGFANDPKNVSIGLKLAEVLDKQGEQDKAVGALRETAKAFGPITDQYWRLIDYLLDLRNLDLSTSLVERASETSKKDPRITYFRGRLALLNNDWIEARALLEEAAPMLVKLPAHHKRAMVGLGVVYEILQNPDQQLNCYRNALRDDPSYLLALVGEAEALAALGKLDEAINRYQSLVTFYQLAELRPTLARLRLLDMLRKPPENRNWTRFDSDDTLGPAGNRSTGLMILYAQSLAARGERDKAIKLLQEVKSDKNAATAAAWVALARIQEAGKPEAALQLLEDAQRQIGDSIELRLARADILVFRAKSPTADEFEQLASGLARFSKPNQYRLCYGLGQAALHAMSPLPEGEARKSLQDAAFRFLQLAAEAEPRDLHCRAILVDLAMAADRRDNLDKTIAEIARLEGPNGPISTLAKVSMRLSEVKTLPNAAAQIALIHELREMTLQVQKQRPGWGKVYIALGNLDELEGLNDQALEHYRQAIDAGDRDVNVIRKTVALYRERKQDSKASVMLGELSTKMVLPEELDRFRAIHEMLNRTLDRRERGTIDRIAPASSRDARILSLRGALLAAIREDADALRAFRRAIELAEDNPETWQELVRQLIRTGDAAAARKALTEAEQKLLASAPKTKNARVDLLITLGECSEMCGDPKTAEARYREALQAAPKELKPNRRIVEYLVRSGRKNECERFLEMLADDASQDLARWARRFLATNLLMTRPDAYQQRGKALDLIARNLAVAPNDPEDIKAQAVILTYDPSRREEGIRTLKEYSTKSELTPDEAYLLGMLIFNQGPKKIPESARYFEAAARPRPGVAPEHIAGYVRVLAFLGEIGLAESQLERLRAIAPTGWEPTREEARLLMKKSHAALVANNRDEAEKLRVQARDTILKFPGNERADIIQFKTGPLLAELGFVPEAVSSYLKLLKLSDSPTAHVPLAVLYIENKRTAEAIQLAREYQSRAPVLLTAQIFSAAIRVKRPSSTAESDAEAWINDKIKEFKGKPEHAGLLAARAELFDAQGKYAKAIEEYRNSINESRSDTAINNVAMLIALYQPRKIDEAIELITKVIDVRGPIPGLLDTRAVAYIVKGGDATEKAVEDLKMALLQNSRSVYAYHLAWAYDLQQKRLERDKALEEARRNGIEMDDVHPLEHDTYRRLFGPDAK